MPAEATAAQSTKSRFRGIPDFQLLEEAVPGIRERLDMLQVENPELWEELRRRAVDTAPGFRPLHWWRGCL